MMNLTKVKCHVRCYRLRGTLRPILIHEQTFRENRTITLQLGLAELSSSALLLGRRAGGKSASCGGEAARVTALDLRSDQDSRKRAWRSAFPAQWTNARPD